MLRAQMGEEKLALTVGWLLNLVIFLLQIINTARTG